MRHSLAVTYIRQLCALGLGGQLLMPELVRSLHYAVPSHLNVFLYAGQAGQLANIYSEFPGFIQLTKIFVENFIQGSEKIPSFSECRPQKIHIPLHAAIRNRAGRALGAMLLYREPGACNFTSEEMGHMASFIPHIAHGLHSRPDLSGPAVESEDRGLLIIRPPSNVIFMSRQVHALAHFVLNLPAVLGRDDGAHAALQPILARLRNNLRDVFIGRAAPPPTVSLQSPWGKFVLRAYWPESPHAEEAGLVGITIDRHEPLSLHLLRNMRASGLTERQRELCLLLFDGLSIPAVAKRLRVSQHTVVDHLKKIYLKLDVHSRDELRSRLEAGSDAGQP